MWNQLFIVLTGFTMYQNCFIHFLRQNMQCTCSCSVDQHDWKKKKQYCIPWHWSCWYTKLLRRLFAAMIMMMPYDPSSKLKLMNPLKVLKNQKQILSMLSFPPSLKSIDWRAELLPKFIIKSRLQNQNQQQL